MVFVLFPNVINPFVHFFYYIAIAKIDVKVLHINWISSILAGQWSSFPLCFGRNDNLLLMNIQIISDWTPHILIAHRYWKTLVYMVKCKQSEIRNDKVKQKMWHERLVSEDSDVALVRVFECFLEAAPQKILQISIILSGEESITSETFHSIMYKS